MLRRMRQPMIALLAVALVLAQGALAPLAGKVVCLAAAPLDHPSHASCAGHASHASHAAPKWPRVHEPAAAKVDCTHQDIRARQHHTVCAAHEECSCHVHVPLPQLKAGLHHAVQDNKPLLNEGPAAIAVVCLPEITQPWGAWSALARPGPDPDHAGCAAQVACIRTTRLLI